MSRLEEYAKIDDLWILELIYRCIVNVTKEG